MMMKKNPLQRKIGRFYPIKWLNIFRERKSHAYMFYYLVVTLFYILFFLSSIPKQFSNDFNYLTDIIFILYLIVYACYIKFVSFRFPFQQHVSTARQSGRVRSLDCRRASHNVRSTSAHVRKPRGRRQRARSVWRQSGWLCRRGLYLGVL